SCAASPSRTNRPGHRKNSPGPLRENPGLTSITTTRICPDAVGGLSGGPPSNRLVFAPVNRLRILQIAGGIRLIVLGHRASTLARREHSQPAGLNNPGEMTVNSRLMLQCSQSVAPVERQQPTDRPS